MNFLFRLRRPKTEMTIASDKKNFKKLPKTLKELDVSYKMLIKELGKR